MKRLIIESYEYKGYIIQRLQNHIWYAVKDNLIVDSDQYQNDIKERIDIHEQERVKMLKEHAESLKDFKL